MSASPTHVVKVLKKSTGQKATVGAAWMNDKGDLSIVLDPCVVLTSDKDIVITVFPKKTE